MNRIITVAREFGSGGRELGRRIAQELNIAYYDHEIVLELSRRTQMTEQYIRQIDEKADMSLLPITTANTFSMQFYPAQDIGLTVFKEQSRIIREMAEKSDCVIVGRCGDYILLAYREDFRRTIRLGTEKRRKLLEHAALRLKLAHPRQRLNESRQYAADLETRIRARMEERMTAEKHRLALCVEKMKGLSPLLKLSQGYSYVQTAEGENIKSISQAKKGDSLDIYVCDGRVKAQVISTEPVSYPEGQA